MPMKKVRLLIADDHAVVRKGLLTLLEDEAGIEIVGEAADGIEAIEKIKILQPDIVLLDITMPRMSGIEAAKVLSEKHPDVKALIFSMHHNQEYILAAVENGAYGYLLKDTSKAEILDAIKTVSSGDKYFPPTVSTVIVNALLSRSNIAMITTEVLDKDKNLTKLSKKERLILRYIADGLSSREIADQLKLSIRTVSNHRANIIRKTKARNTAELVKMAVKEHRV